jgi:hypothetical protein
MATAVRNSNLAHMNFIIYNFVCNVQVRERMLLAANKAKVIWERAYVISVVKTETGNTTCVEAIR